MSLVLISGSGWRVARMIRQLDQLTVGRTDYQGQWYSAWHMSSNCDSACLHSSEEHPVSGCSCNNAAIFCSVLDFEISQLLVSLYSLLFALSLEGWVKTTDLLYFAILKSFRLWSKRFLKIRRNWRESLTYFATAGKEKKNSLNLQQPHTVQPRQLCPQGLNTFDTWFQVSPLSHMMAEQ